jgi:hypothetical protein
MGSTTLSFALDWRQDDADVVQMERVNPRSAVFAITHAAQIATLAAPYAPPYDLGARLLPMKTLSGWSGYMSNGPLRA